MNRTNLSHDLALEPDLTDTYVKMLAGRGQQVSLSAGQYVFHQGQPATSVYLLLDGTLKTTCSDERGNETLLKIHSPGSVIGLSALRPDPQRDANCIAVEQSRAAQFGRAEFFDLMRADGELGILVVRLLLKRQQLLHSRVSDATGLSVEQRLARVLVQMHAERRASDESGGLPVLRISHADLAALVFSRRQYVTAILRQFSARGLIENRRQRITVVDVQRLSEVVSG